MHNVTASSRRPFPRSNAAGFTLVELLVVISIIAILIALLLPSLSRAKLVSYQVKCAASIRMWNTAALNYAADNKSYLPQRGPDYYSLQYVDFVGSLHRTQVEAYGMELRSAYCPESPFPVEVRETLFNAANPVLGYAYYPNLTQNGASTILPGTIRPNSAVRSTDEFDQTGHRSILYADVDRFRDAGTWTPYVNSHPDPGAQSITNPPAMTGLWFDLVSTKPRGLNVGYTDAHVSWLTPSTIDIQFQYTTQDGWIDSSYYWQ